MEVRRIGPDGGFLREFTDVRKRVQHLETRPSGVIATREMFIVTDPETGVKTIMGKLPDGSTGFQPFVGDIVPPPVATAPTASAQPGTITVTWDGTFVAGAEQPADFEHLNVIGHKIVTGTTVLSLEVGSIRLANESVVITTDIISYGEQWQFSFESEDYNGNISVRSDRTPIIDVISYVDDSLVGEALAAIEADVVAAQQASTDAQLAANAAQDAADAVAMNLSSTSAEVTAAQLKADQAFNVATDAATDAGNAQTSADSKNKIWYQTTAPAGTGHKSGDTWFDTDDGNRIYIWTGAAWTDHRDAGIAAAQTAANTALTSANGKNKNYYQTTMPSGGTYILGDTWFDTDDGNKIYNYNGTTFVEAPLGANAIADQAITNAKIADATIQAAKIGSVDAGTISVGTLGAGRIGADSITADKLLVSRGANLFTDPTIRDSAGWADSPYFDPTGGKNGGGSILLPTGATQSGLYYAQAANLSPRRTRLVAGGTYRLGGWVRTSADAPIGTVQLYLRYHTEGSTTGAIASNVATAIPYNTAIVPANTWTFISGMVTIPESTTYTTGVLGVFKQAGYTTGATRWSDLSIQQAMAGELIVDGSVTTNHMTAGTIDASVLTAGSITAPKIAAKTITTDKLVITSSDNLVVGGDMALSAASWQKSTYVTASAATGRGGGSTLRFTGSVAAQSSLNLTNRVTVEPDNKFRCSVFVKSTAALAIDRVRLMVRCFTTATAYTDVIGTYNTAALVANTWTQIQGVSAPLPANTIAVEFYLYVTNNATGTITDIDYVSVTRASDATLVVDGAITAKKLETELVLATKIVAGDVAGTHAEMSPEGFRVYADSAEVGAPSTEVVRLGVANTNDYFAITKSTGELAATISQDGIGSFAQVNATNAFYYKGKEIYEILDALPKGSLYKAELSTDLDNITTRYGLVEAQFVIKGDRQIELAGGIKFYPVDPVTECYVDIRYTVDGTAPTINSTLLVNIPLGTVSNTTFDYKEFRHTIRPATFAGAPGVVSTAWEGKTMRLLMIIYKGNGLKLMPRAGFSTYLYVTDVGKGIPHVPNFTPGGGSNPTPQPPAPAQQTYVKQYQCTNSMNYQGSNAQYNFDTGHMYQGLSPAGYGNLKSIALFPDMTADLSGASINYIRVYFNFVHWYYNSGGTAYIGVHPHTAIPGSFTWTGNGQTGGRVATSAGWPKPGARWVDLPADQWNNFKSGIWKGITLDGDGTYGTYGYADRPTIEISYTK